MNFQRSFGLIEDGIVGRETWNRIYALYETLSDKIVPDESIPEYPGMTLQQGSSGENVRRIQTALNNISTQYPSIPLLVEDGIFGTATTTAVRAFQRQFGLTVDGIVGVLTWNKIFEVSALIDAGEEAGEEMPPYPGTLLRNGSRGNAVRLMQERLKSISIYYPVIPDITADGIFGPATQAAVIAFQQMMGITADGIIGQQTWELINTVYNELFIKKKLRVRSFRTIGFFFFRQCDQCVQQHIFCISIHATVRQQLPADHPALLFCTALHLPILPDRIHPE